MGDMLEQKANGSHWGCRFAQTNNNSNQQRKIATIAWQWSAFLSPYTTANIFVIFLIWILLSLLGLFPSNGVFYFIRTFFFFPALTFRSLLIVSECKFNSLILFFVLWVYVLFSVVGCCVCGQFSSFHQWYSYNHYDYECRFGHTQTHTSTYRAEKKSIR